MIQEGREHESQIKQSQIVLGDWTLDPNSNTVWNAQYSTQLEFKPFQLLVYFIAHPSCILGKDQVLENLWPGRVVVDDVITVAVSQIRKALRDNARKPIYIKTIPGKGYQFIFPVSEDSVQRAERFLNPSAEPKHPEVLPTEKQIFIAGVSRRRATLRFSFTLLFMMLIFSGLYFIAFKTGDPILVKSLSTSEKERFDEAQRLFYSRGPDNAQRGIALLEELIRAQPEFSDAYVLMANFKRGLAYHNRQIEQETSKELKALLHKALKINPQSTYAHSTMANVLFFIDWNHKAARDHLERALKLDRGNADVHHLYGLFLLAHGEFDASHQHIMESRKLNPLYYSVPVVAWVLAMQEKYEEAWDETEKLLTFQPNEFQYHRSAQRLLEYSGRYDESYRHLRKMLELSGYSQDELSRTDEIHQKDTLTGVFLWLAEEKKEERDIGFYTPPLSFARYAISSGNHDQALFWLEQAAQSHQRELLWMGIDPIFKPIRSDQRFLKIASRVGVAVDNSSNAVEKQRVAAE